MTYDKDEPNAADNIKWEDVKKNPVNIPIDWQAIEEQRTQQRRHRHNWRQRGVEIYCQDGQHETHGFYVSPDHKLVGIDAQGEPIIKHYLDVGEPSS